MRTRWVAIGALVVLLGGCSDGAGGAGTDGPSGDGPVDHGDGATGGDGGTDGTPPGDGGHQHDGGAPVDLCQGLLTDKAAHPMTALARPALLGTVVDPEFGTTIRRISDSGSTGAIKPMYSTIPAWNADESRLILYDVASGHRLHDGQTYAFIRALDDISPADIEQVYWHPTDPDVLLYVDDKTLTRYHVGAASKEAVHTFSTCTESVTGGADPMYISWDGNVIGLRCGSSAFSYRLDTNSVGGPTASGSDTAPQAAPGGTRLYFDGDVLGLDMVTQRTLDMANPNEHASLGRLANGDDGWFGVTYDPGSSGCDAVGALVTYSLVDGSCHVIIGEDTGYPYPGSGVHVSALVLQRSGWAVVGTVGDTAGQGLLDQELVLVDTSSPARVCRVAHHRSWGKDGPQGYWAEPHAVPSPSGTRILFGSDWGGGASVDAYVVELPAYQ
jgi:hypothetical protein